LNIYNDSLINVEYFFSKIYEIIKRGIIKKIRI
jgi:hypothetical protein